MMVGRHIALQLDEPLTHGKGRRIAGLPQVHSNRTLEGRGDDIWKVLCLS
jgi:hypothetical protein